MAPLPSGARVEPPLLLQARRLAQARRWDEASRLYRELLARAPDDVDALEGLGLVALQCDRAGEGLELLSRARQHAPDNARVVGHLGIAQRRMGQLNEAVATLQHAVELERAPSRLINLARAQREAGQLTQAIQTFQQALELDPQTPDAWSMSSNALREAGRCEEALVAARRASAQNPWSGQAHLNEGAALHRLGHLGDAVASYWVASTLASSRNAAAANLSLVLADPNCQGTAAPAEVGLVRRLLQAPDDATTMRQLGALQREKQRSAAIGCFELAADRAPSAAAYHELGVLFWGMGQAELSHARFLRAFACADADVHAYRRLNAWLDAQPLFRLLGGEWQAVLARCPDDVVTLVNLGLSLQRQGLPSEAERLHRRALLLDANRIEAHINWGGALCDQGRSREATEAYRRALELDPTCANSASNLLFGLHLDPSLSPEAIFAEHLQFGQRFGKPRSSPARSFVRDRDPERPLRIGYVSPDFRWHPVAYFLEPVLAAHDRRAVEVYCYSDVERPDPVTARLAGWVPHFVRCAGWSNARLEQQIVADQIDILVDLAGHTGKNRLLVFAEKPSPIQVSWLGYFDTTGLSAIDYRIADEHSVPEAAERFFVERVVRLPRSANCFLHPESPEPSPPPCARRGHVTFGCFNKVAKVTRHVVATFARILSQLPDSRLVLKFSGFDDPVLHAQYLRWFAEEGIARERIELAGHSPLPQFLAALEHVDIALDPFPYSGETTALHTLWMGVPLVALEGVTLVQRLASRVLRVAGLSEWVACSEDDYVRIAVSLGRDPEKLSPLRAGLRERLKASPLLDHAGVTRELEAAYRQMWQRWCASSEPGATRSEQALDADPERRPEDVPTLVNRGVDLQLQRLPSEAERLYRRALELDPTCIPAHVNCGAALCDQGRFRDAAAVYRRGLELDPWCAELASNLLFSLNFDPSLSPEAVFAEHLQLGQRIGERLSKPARQPACDLDPQRRLRIGYVSPDFCSHPVADFLEPVLAAHDRRAVEVFCYSDVARPDAVTARLAGLSSHFIPCAGSTNATLAERIASDRVDILVDLAGHTGNGRLLAFAEKPSPIQVSWLGYGATTGLSAIDYRIADEHSVPESAERFFVERIVRLPRSANCYLHPASPEPAPAPCLRRGHVTFGCFNNPAKVGREVVATFARILNQLPSSRLSLRYGTFADPLLRAQYVRWFGEEGIPPARIDLFGHSPLEEYLESFAHVDIALDPFPYSGETTALHTLWMGVPLVALEGVTLVQRLASRVLRVAGLAEWVARSTDEYAAIALSLARDPARLAEWRTRLRDRLKASPLLDHQGVTRELEAAYRQMWQRYCAAQSR